MPNSEGKTATRAIDRAPIHDQSALYSGKPE
jgi:hypothetical protein